ncbi:MAG: hypothetical protein LBC57_09785 [Treponema sp.]|jgi:hypothetical protein|nr:hypothetical protein [Treponema sp.]
MLSELIAKYNRIPSLDETNTQPYGPVMGKHRRRTLCIYGLLCIIGLLPALLSWFTPLEIPPKLIASGAGLLVPGGGFLAQGTFHGIFHGLLVLGIFMLAGLETYFLFGDLVLPTLIWLFGIWGGTQVSGSIPAWGPLISVAAAAIPVAYCRIKIHGMIVHFKTVREQRLKTIDASIQRVEALCSKAPESEERELTQEALQASRYLYDLCLSGQGLRYFDNMLFPSLSGLYYQFSNVGYSLMTLQCKYLPNFHGYLDEAQRFLIESYTLPRICAYWKWEALAGYGRWQPDPVIRGNIMLAGWAYALIAGYEANTGDMRYDRPEGLRFRPFKHLNKTYGHSTSEIIESFERQLLTEPATLIPCEPRLQFPICNSYAIVAMMSYDRIHHTNHTERIYEKFINAIREEFCEMNGDMAIQRFQLTGLRVARMMSARGSSFGNMIIAQAYNPIYPGLARRCYSIVRDELVTIGEDGLAYFKGGIPWDKMLDMGTQTYSPGSAIGGLEIAAQEFGDYELVEALRKTEEKYLIPSRLRFKFKGVSVCGMTGLAASRWNRKNDWQDTILKGPPEAAYTGPALTGCSYPEVLVAKAFSHGEDLELVLYNGTENKNQTIGIERLQKDRIYTVKETGLKIRSDTAGKASIDCNLDGRTQLTLIPA